MPEFAVKMGNRFLAGESLEALLSDFEEQRAAAARGEGEPLRDEQWETMISLCVHAGEHFRGVDLFDEAVAGGFFQGARYQEENKLKSFQQESALHKHVSGLLSDSMTASEPDVSGEEQAQLDAAVEKFRGAKFDLPSKTFSLDGRSFPMEQLSSVFADLLGGGEKAARLLKKVTSGMVSDADSLFDGHKADGSLLQKAAESSDAQRLATIGSEFERAFSAKLTDDGTDFGEHSFLLGEKEFDVADLPDAFTDMLGGAEQAQDVLRAYATHQREEVAARGRHNVLGELDEGFANMFDEGAHGKLHELLTDANPERLMEQLHDVSEANVADAAADAHLISILERLPADKNPDDDEPELWEQRWQFLQARADSHFSELADHQATPMDRINRYLRLFQGDDAAHYRASIQADLQEQFGPDDWFLNATLNLK